MESGSALHPQAHRDDWGKDLLDRVGRSFGAARVGGSGAWCGWKQRRSGSPTEEEGRKRKRKKKKREDGSGVFCFCQVCLCEQTNNYSAPKPPEN